MSTLNQQFPTLVDLAELPKSQDVADIINLLAQYNPILTDAPSFECNDGTSHKTTVMTGLPSVIWGRLYQGVPATKGTRQTVKDTCGYMKTACEVDADMVDVFEKAEDKANMRLSEAEAHLEALSQEAASSIFYADIRTEPDKFMGFAPRFSDLSADNGTQIIDGGGVGNDNTSIWFITWDRSGSHLLRPKGANLGIERKDAGNEYYAQDGNGDKYHAYREDFKWHIGLTVRNWQYISRVANIDVSDLTIDAATGADVVNLMTEAYYAHKGRRLQKGKTIIYANTNIVKYLDYQARYKTDQNLFLTYGEQGPNAKEVLMFRGLPIHETDALLNTEEAVA
jgi:hypothetical protein